MIPKRKSKNIFDTPGWKNTEKITILSENHLKKLLSQGFEIKGVSFAWVPDKTDIVLYLASKKKRLVADALRIGRYVIHLQDLYDFNLRKTRFTWVSDTSIYWNFEVKLTQMLTGEFKRPISRRMIDSYYRDTIFNRMNDWVKSKKGRTSPKSNLSILFSQVYIINENENEIFAREISKERFESGSLGKILREASRLKSSIALSFFYLTRKVGRGEINDFVIGLIVYDLKTRKVVCFNLKSLEPLLMMGNGSNLSDGFFHIALNLFSESARYRRIQLIFAFTFGLALVYSVTMVFLHIISRPKFTRKS